MADIELYAFTAGLKTYRYTDALLPATWETHTYAAEPIKRGRIVMTQDLEKATLDITVPLTLPLLDLFRPNPPLQKIDVTVTRITRGVTTFDPIRGTPRVLWRGTLGNIDNGMHTASLKVLTRAAAQSNTGLRRKWQKSSAYGPYTPQGRVSLSSVRVDGTVTTVAPRSVQVPAAAGKPDGWFAGGVLEFTAAGDTLRRFIVSHVGDTLTLLTAPALPVGTAVHLYPGCDGSIDDWQAKFGDVQDFGGQPYIPTTNPFGPAKIF